MCVFCILVILYGLCLVCSLTALIISVTVINLCKKKRSKPLPHAVSNLLTKKTVKTALILPNIVVRLPIRMKIYLLFVVKYEILDA